MSTISTLSARTRDRVGKGSARAARREGLVPAVIYGDNKDPLPITVTRRDLGKFLKPGFFSHLIDIEVGGEKHRVLPRDLQQHPVSDWAWHVDFLRVSATSEIAVEVPVEFVNEEACPGLRRGGVLNVVRHEIEVYCLPGNIPEKIAIDLTGLQIGDALHISAVTLPEGVRPTIERDFTVVTIAAPTLISQEAADAQAESQAAAHEDDEDEDDEE